MGIVLKIYEPSEFISSRVFASSFRIMHYGIVLGLGFELRLGKKLLRIEH